MAKDRNPSGLPKDRIVTSMWGYGESDVESRVGLQHDGLRRTRRTFFVMSIIVAIGVLLVAIFGSWDSAMGMAMILLGPLLFFLLINHILVEFTAPKQRRR